MQVATRGARQPKGHHRMQGEHAWEDGTISCLFLCRNKFNDGEVNAFALNKQAAWKAQGP